MLTVKYLLQPLDKMCQTCIPELTVKAESSKETEHLSSTGSLCRREGPHRKNATRHRNVLLGGTCRHSSWHLEASEGDSQTSAEFR